MIRIDKTLRVFVMDIKEKLINTHLPGVPYLPRYVVLFIDIFLTALALGFTSLALIAVNFPFDEVESLTIKIYILLGTNILFHFLFKTYTGLIRHTSFKDVLKLAFASGGALFGLIVLHYLYLWATDITLFVIIALIHYSILAFTFQVIFRLIIKLLYHNFKEKNLRKNKLRIAIFGIDDHAISMGKIIASQPGQKFHVVAFLTDKPIKKIQIAGTPVICIQPSLSNAIKSLNLQGVLLIEKNNFDIRKNEVVNLYMELGLQVFNAPLIEKWDFGKNILSNIKAVEIEDLLDREPIELDNVSIKDDLQGATILITGAAGSIGSELVRQIAAYNPGKLVLVDQAETPLYSLELELKEKYPDLNFKPVLATISNKYRMEALFKKHSFAVVFNAAAYKHVPMIEKNPREAIVVNVLGTVNLATLSSKYGVNKFVMVSTDKAVNPTNVMGASKRAAEMYVQAFQKLRGNSTQFIITRFGNVLGSNGSVIPYFKEQIAKGGPVTVTHPEVIRYFMTIPEACQLVLQAGTMGRGGEIFIFDMGKPVKILNLAKRMIRLSGFKPYVDIDIKIIGLRPGEKLYEELLSNTTTALPTHNKKILISKDYSLPFEEIEEKTKCLIRAAVKAEDKREMVKHLKSLVPEFISKNSIYESLDEERMMNLKNSNSFAV